MGRVADVVRRAWHRSPFEVIGTVVALLVVVGGLGLLLVTVLGLDQRSRSSVEEEAAEVTSAYYRVPITALCSDPEDDQWRCTLRAADGRRGWLSQDVRYEGDPGFRRSRPRDDVTRAEFPVIGADGRQVETLEVVPGAPVATAAAVRSWYGAWSVEPSAASVIRNQLRCPEPTGQAVTPCTARGDVVSATLRRVGPSAVEMVVLWR